jgi:ABC-2 type transport system ATP-binding protein
VEGIVAEGVSRSFAVRDRSRGLGGAVADLFRPARGEKHALIDVSFRIRPGEAVALIGPNGAGKSTTVKLLTGILSPTGGRVRVNGRDPWAERTAHVREVGVVFGQRTQLWWDLAVVEAYDLLAAMYDVPAATYRERLARFDAVLGVGPLLRTPLRQLSLGERMRCELAGALLHAPPLLILDEPTVGLDVAVKLRLRAFLASLRDEGRTTVLLTTHDLEDVRALCPRVLLLAEGRLLHDGPLEELAARLGGRRTVRATLRTPASITDLAAFPGAEARSPEVLAVPLPEGAAAAELVRGLVTRLDVLDLHIEEPAIDTLVARFYEGRP